ncbi:hypothetical protein Q7I18_15370 [Aeromonas veronii]|uniref:hypothetical protein n=1 Tax=Aeromonas veronii TaxID=654 RepID=UPI003007B9C7
MNVLPSPPTDNLYKFSAISGLLILLFSIAGLVYLTFLLSNYEKATNLHLQSNDAEISIREINCRIDAIKHGHIEKCPYREIRRESLEDELNILLAIKRSDESIITEYKRYSELSQPLKENFEWIFNTRFFWFLLITPSFAIILFILGLSRWYKKVQVPMNELTYLNLKIRTLELAKLELEVIQLKSKSKPNFKYRKRSENIR